MSEEMQQYPCGQKFLRGQVWMVHEDKDITEHKIDTGSLVIAKSRPHLIVHGGGDINGSRRPVLALPCTTNAASVSGIEGDVVMYINGKLARILTGQLLAVDASKFVSYICTVPPDIMLKVDRGLANALGLFITIDEMLKRMAYLRELYDTVYAPESKEQVLRQMQDILDQADGKNLIEVPVNHRSHEPTRRTPESKPKVKKADDVNKATDAESKAAESWSDPNPRGIIVPLKKDHDTSAPVTKKETTQVAAPKPKPAAAPEPPAPIPEPKEVIEKLTKGIGTDTPKTAMALAFGNAVDNARFNDAVRNLTGKISGPKPQATPVETPKNPEPANMEVKPLTPAISMKVRLTLGREPIMPGANGKQRTWSDEACQDILKLKTKGLSYEELSAVYSMTEDQMKHSIAYCKKKAGQSSLGAMAREVLS